MLSSFCGYTWGAAYISETTRGFPKISWSELPAEKKNLEEDEKYAGTLPLRHSSHCTFLFLPFLIFSPVVLPIHLSTPSTFFEALIYFVRSDEDISIVVLWHHVTSLCASNIRQISRHILRSIKRTTRINDFWLCTRPWINYITCKSELVLTTCYRYCKRKKKVKT